MDYEAAFQQRDNKYLTSTAKNQLQLYSIDEVVDHTKLIGSLSYKIPNAADTDLYEIVRGTTKSGVLHIFMNGLRRIVNRLTNTAGQLFAEVKLGLNPTYLIDCGSLVNGQYSLTEGFYNICSEYLNKGLLTPDEMAIIESVRSNGGSQKEYELIRNIFRLHSVLRWSAYEINNGFKIVKDYDGNPRKYTIEEGLSCKSAINIEGVYLNNENFYVECSNYFVLVYIQNGKVTPLNIPFGLSPDYFIEGLKQSIYTLTYSKIGLYNPFKAIKRIFSLARFNKDVKFLKVAYDAIASQTGLLYALTSQLGTLAKVIALNNRYKTRITAIYTQLDTLKFKFQTIILANFDISTVLSSLNELLQDTSQSIIKMESIRETLLSLIVNNKKYLNVVGLEYMVANGLYPLPPALLPKSKPF